MNPSDDNDASRPRGEPTLPARSAGERLRLIALRRLHTVAAVAAQPLQDRWLTRLIRGRRVLILGSGPSAAALGPVPADVLVFSCNSAIAALMRPGFRREVDLYACNGAPLRTHRAQLLEIAREFRFSFLLTRQPWRIREAGVFRYERLMADRATGRGGLLQRRVLGRPLMRRLAALCRSGFPSTGIGLMLYALHYGAREIHLAGIDLNTAGYAFSERANSAYAREHGVFDLGVVRFAHERYGNLSVVTPGSPLAALLPCRPLSPTDPA